MLDDLKTRREQLQEELKATRRLMDIIQTHQLDIAELKASLASEQRQLSESRARQQAPHDPPDPEALSLSLEIDIRQHRIELLTLQIQEHEAQLENMRGTYPKYETVEAKFAALEAAYEQAEATYQAALQEKRAAILARQDWNATRLLILETELNTLRLVLQGMVTNQLQIHQRIETLERDICHLIESTP